MAELWFKAGGRRWPALARRVAEENPHAELVEEGGRYVVRGPTLAVTRRMVEETCFPDGARHAGTPSRLLYGLALLRKGRLLARSEDRIVIGDDDGERAMTVRIRADHRDAIARLSDRLDMSRNEFVVRAIEHFVDYLEESRDLAAAEGGD